MVVYADGTTWNPGSGKGPYIYFNGAWKAFIQTQVALADLATLAVALQTARNINGVSFNGAADITVYSGIQGQFKNLKISALGATNPSAILTADEVTLENTSNVYFIARSLNLTINSTTSGANGLDAGSVAASTWYSVWAIAKPDTTVAGLLSLSTTAPTMPSGYTFKARLGWVRTDGTGNKYLLQTLQYGAQAQYVVTSGTNVAAMPTLASGAAGNSATPTWVSVGVSTFVPPTTASIVVSGASTGSNLIAAPNNSYGVLGSTTNPAPIANNSASTVITTSLVLESTDIYWANGGAGAAIYCFGWKDNL
jgi:hypothetical protein